MISLGRLTCVSDRYIAWLNDPDVMRYLEARFEKHSRETIEKYILEMNESPLNYLFAIMLGDKHIGNAKIGPINISHSYAPIGLLIGEKELWGQGYGTQAVAKVTAFALDRLNLHKTIAGMYAGNPGSYQAFIKSGYREVGLWKNHCRFDDGWTDIVSVEKQNPTGIDSEG